MTIFFFLPYATSLGFFFLPPSLKHTHKIKAKYTITFIPYKRSSIVIFIIYFFVFQFRQLVATTEVVTDSFRFRKKKKTATSLIIVKTAYTIQLQQRTAAAVVCIFIDSSREKKTYKPEFCHKVKPWLANRKYLRCTKQIRATMEFSGLPRTVRIDVLVIYLFFSRRKTLRSPRRLMKFFYVIVHFSFHFVSCFFFFIFTP